LLLCVILLRERQYALRLTVPFSSFLSATQLQFLPALHASSFFRELHVAHFSGGAGFLSCAFDSFANAMTIATLPSVQTWLRTTWFMALLLASAVAPLPPGTRSRRQIGGSMRSIETRSCTAFGR